MQDSTLVNMLPIHITFKSGILILTWDMLDFENLGLIYTHKRSNVDVQNVHNVLEFTVVWTLAFSSIYMLKLIEFQHLS